MAFFGRQVQRHFAISSNQMNFGPRIQPFSKSFENLMTRFKRKLQIRHLSFSSIFYRAEDFITQFLHTGFTIGYGYITG